MDTQTKILFIAEKSHWCYEALAFLKEHFAKVESIFWNRGEPQKPCMESWNGDWIISFKSDLLLAQKQIDTAAKGAINFHPAPPRYPGIGGYQYAVYNGDASYGVTCHHMTEKTDNGRIIKVKYFALKKDETASHLRETAAMHCFDLLCEMMEYIIEKKDLPTTNEAWEEKLYTYKHLDNFINALRSRKTHHNCLV